MNNQSKFAPTATLASVLKTAYIISIVVLVVAVFSDILEIRLIQSVMDGAMISEAEANQNDNRQMYIGILQVVVTLFTFVTFLIWYYRSYKNLKLFEDHQNEYSNKMAIANFFIPIINLWRPYKSTKEMWTVSQPSEESKKSQPVFDSSYQVIGIWWALFLIHNFLARILIRVAFDSQTLDEIYYTSIAFLASDIIEIPLLILEFFIVVTITAWQKSRYEKGSVSFPQLS